MRMNPQFFGHVYDMWQAKTEYQDNRYTVPIPWRAGRPCFPDNRYLAEKRLESTLKRLNRTGMYEVYNENVQKLVHDGHAELIPSGQLGQYGICHIMPFYKWSKF